MTQDIIIDIMRQGLMTVVLAAAPPLIMGLTVGLIVSIFQAVTSIQEATLAFVPKILAVLISLLVFGPYIMNTINSLFINLYNNIPYYITPK